MATELGAYDITVYGDPYKIYNTEKVYENTVATIIRSDIAKRRTGQLILRRIRESKGDVEIYPRYKEGLNAEATFKLKDDRGHRYSDKIIVWYKPEQWAISHPPERLTIPNNLRAFQPAHLRDEVLFHELVHCGRLLDGFRQKTETLTTGIAAAYEDREEFATILVTNIYLSEKGAKVFRASHGVPGFPFILDQAQSSSEGFLKIKDNYDLVKQFCQTDPLAPKLVAIDTLFNPVRAYLLGHPEDIELNNSLQPQPATNSWVGSMPM
jgi:hypothetical protein